MLESRLYFGTYHVHVPKLEPTRVSSVSCNSAHKLLSVFSFLFFSFRFSPVRVVTTLRPHLGSMVFDNSTMPHRIVIADVPGLVEGARANRGMGHRFLRHLERTRGLLFVIDINGFQLSPRDPFRTARETVSLLLHEVHAYRSKGAQGAHVLRSRPFAVAFTKTESDEQRILAQQCIEYTNVEWNEMVRREQREEKTEAHKKKKATTQPKAVVFAGAVAVSSHTGDGLEELGELLLHFKPK